MNVLDKLLQERIEERQEIARERAEQQRREDEKRRAQENAASDFVAQYIDQEYGAPISDELLLSACREAGGSFKVTLRFDIDDDNCRVDLMNPIGSRDGCMVILELRSGITEWRGVHDGLRCSYPNLLDAILYAKYGTVTPELEAS